MFFVNLVSVTENKSPAILHTCTTQYHVFMKVGKSLVNDASWITELEAKPCINCGMTAGESNEIV